MGRTACTEPQCLYKGALYLYLQYWLLIVIKPKAEVGYFLCLLLFFSFHNTTRITVTKVYIFRKSATTYHSRTYEQVAIVFFPSHQLAHHVITHCWTRK